MKENKKIWLASPHMGGVEWSFVKEAFDTNWIAPIGPHISKFENNLSDIHNENSYDDCKSKDDYSDIDDKDRKYVENYLAIVNEISDQYETKYFEENGVHTEGYWFDYLKELITEE